MRNTPRACEDCRKCKLLKGKIFNQNGDEIDMNTQQQYKQFDEICQKF
jgi:hypothetical protein